MQWRANLNTKTIKTSVEVQDKSRSNCDYKFKWCGIFLANEIIELWSLQFRMIDDTPII